MSTQAIQRSRKVVDEEKKKQLEEVLSAEFNLVSFIEEKQMGNLDGRKMACPFHEDLSPSLFVDDSRNIWKCHSCGRGGGFVSMYQHWSNVLQGTNLTYYEAMDAILLSNKKLRSQMGFGSIFKSEQEKLDLSKVVAKLTQDYGTMQVQFAVETMEKESTHLTAKPQRVIKPRRMVKPKYGAKVTYKKIIEDILKENEDGKDKLDKLLDAMAMIQKGRSPEAIAVSSKLDRVDENFSLHDLLDAHL